VSSVSFAISAFENSTDGFSENRFYFKSFRLNLVKAFAPAFCVGGMPQQHPLAVRILRTLFGQNGIFGHFPFGSGLTHSDVIGPHTSRFEFAASTNRLSTSN
jgi:hypothetical protein